MEGPSLSGVVVVDPAVYLEIRPAVRPWASAVGRRGSLIFEQ
jgi:hypothetical protein